MIMRAIRHEKWARLLALPGINKHVLALPATNQRREYLRAFSARFRQYRCCTSDAFVSPNVVSRIVGLCFLMALQVLRRTALPMKTRRLDPANQHRKLRTATAERVSITNIHTQLYVCVPAHVLNRLACA